MTKLEIEAIRRLPAAYVRDGTQVTTLQSIRVVVAINPALRPVMYTPGRGGRHKWKTIEYNPTLPAQP